MAFENMTYEAILERMMARVANNYPNLDTREGSMLFNALAPAAVELAIAYVALDRVLKESFVGTASRNYLFTACEQMGMDTSVFEASFGIFQGEFDVEVPIGSRWNCDLYNYAVSEFIEQDATTQHYKYRMVCETTGTAPNNVTGELSAITDLPTNLTYAQLTDCLIEGENEYTDDEIRTSYFEFVNSVAADGNALQYKRWCNEYDGIGNCKIFPLWNGANTVKVSILSSSNRAASETLISEFQEYLAPLDENNQPDGMGNGKAPIGAFVTVSTATELPITIAATLSLKSGYTTPEGVDDALSNLFSSIAYEDSQVNYMLVGATILSCPSVASVTNLTVNGGTVDVELTSEQIPVRGATNWTVI